MAAYLKNFVPSALYLKHLPNILQILKYNFNIKLNNEQWHSLCKIKKGDEWVNIKSAK